MKKILIISALLVTISMNSKAQVTEYSSLEIGYPTAYDLPAGVVLGVDGHVLIQDGAGTREINDSFKDLFLMFVEKGVLAEDHAILASSVWLADYVFEPDYQLMSLEEKKAYVEEHRHLPNVIGQSQLDKQGQYSVNDMLIGQLQNLEELVLHTIEQEEKIKDLEAQISELQELVTALEEKLKKSDH